MNRNVTIPLKKKKEKRKMNNIINKNVWNMNIIWRATLIECRVDFICIFCGNNKIKYLIKAYIIK